MRTLLAPLAIGFAAATVCAQVPCHSAALGTNLALFDETMSAAQSLGFLFAYGGVGYTQIQVCDNGYITMGPTGGQADFRPLAATLITDSFARICPLWVDLDPGISGSVNFLAVPAAGGTPAHAVITWDNVVEFGGTTPHTFQLILIDGGTIRCRYESNLLQIPSTNPWLIGASPGSPAAPLAVDFGALPLQTNGSATLHQESNGPCALASTTIDWQPDTLGGYLVAAAGNCAAATSFGDGCAGQFTSVYEQFATTAAFDLSNTAFTMVLTGGSYLVTTSTAPFVPLGAAATNLGLTDDSEATITLASPLPFPGGSTGTLNVCSNGHVSVASNSAAFDWTPTPQELLDWPNSTWAVWHDFFPTPTANIWVEEVGPLTIVTWDAVVGYAGTTPGITPSTFQLQFDRANGNVTFVFLGMDTQSVSGWSGGEGYVVGYSPAGTSLDPGNRDLSTTLGAGIPLAAADVAPLALAASARPIIGTAIQLDTIHIPPSSLFGGLMFGLLRHNPGINLASVGMPGCTRYSDALVTLPFVPLGGTTHAVAFTPPNAPGVTFIVQAAVYAPAAGLTPLGAISSNGVALAIGH